MNPAEDRIRNISDTALWAAIYRARETERPDALFRDPFARRLTGDRGDRIAVQMRAHDRHEWAWVLRTVLFDRFIAGRIAAGADMVVNLAAGLDARPYRMALPPALQWVEVDLPGLLDYKEEILRGENPGCALERVRMDLADTAARRELFQRLGSRAKNALVVTEGLLIYLTAEEVGVLAEDLAAPEGFRHCLDCCGCSSAKSAPLSKRRKRRSSSVLPKARRSSKASAGTRYPSSRRSRPRLARNGFLFS